MNTRFDNNSEVIAYELLFRREDLEESNVNNDNGIEGDVATCNVILSAFADVGIENIIGDGSAYINFTRNLLLQPDAFPLPIFK